MMTIGIIFLVSFCMLGFGVMFLPGSNFADKYASWYAGAFWGSLLLSIIFMVLGEK